MHGCFFTIRQRQFSKGWRHLLAHVTSSPTYLLLSEFARPRHGLFSLGEKRCSRPIALTMLTTTAAEYLGVASALVALVAAFALSRRIDRLTEHLLGQRLLVLAIQEAQSEQARLLVELNSLRSALPDLHELGRQLAEAKNQSTDLVDGIAKLTTGLGAVQEMERTIAQMKVEQAHIKHVLDEWRSDFQSAATELAELEPFKG
jgi:hypothetical protein